jgi:hypothetical protein
MTGEQLRDNHLTQLLDGEELGDEIVLSIFNLGKNVIELSRVWRFLIAEDSSQTVSPGNTLTTMKSLPSNFGVEVNMIVGSSSVGYTEYQPVPFEKRRLSVSKGNIEGNVSGLYYIDHGNSQFAIIGDVPQALTIYLNYSILTPELTALSDAFNARWPDRFLPIIAYQGAAMYRGGVDWDDQNARMSPENRAAANMLLQAMIAWNNRLTLKTISNPQNTEVYIPTMQRGPHRII